MEIARHEQGNGIPLRAAGGPIATNKTIALTGFNTDLTKRWLWLACWIVLSSLVFKDPLVALIRSSLSQDDISYLVLIPFIFAWVLFMERRKIFSNLTHNFVWGSFFLLMAGGAALVSLLPVGRSFVDLRLSGHILSLVLVWMAGFALLFGRVASKAARFPLLFLFLMVPPPTFLLDHFIYSLQVGSAWITGALFDLFRIPVLREGFVFHLARVNIEVARECSGIRSSMSLLILALLVSHFCLKSSWNKILFLTCGLFMMVIKNGIRIATLTLLAMYVDQSFLTGRLHRQGGIVFFLLALLLLLPVLLFLQRRESATLKDVESPQTGNVQGRDPLLVERSQ